MKKILLFCLAVLLLLAGCSMNTAPTTGELCITINGSSSRNVTEGDYISSNTAYYMIGILQDHDFYVCKEVPNTGTTISKSFLLRSGVNNIYISAMNSEGDTLASKSFLDVNVVPGTTINKEVTFTDQDLQGNLVIDIQNMDGTGNLYAKVFKIADKPNQLSDQDVTQVLSTQDYIQLNGRYETGKSISGGYYSVRIYNKAGEEFQFLNSLPVKVVSDKSYVSGFYKDSKLTFRPYIELSSVSDVESESDIYLRINNRSDIESGTLIINYNDEEKTFEDKAPSHGSDYTTFRFKGLDLKNTKAVSVDMILEYTVEGDQYLYDLGEITVNPSSPFIIRYYENSIGKDTATFSTDTTIALSAEKSGSSGPSEDYEFKWFIDGTEFASRYGYRLEIKTSDLEASTHNVVAEIRNKSTGVIKTATSSFTIDSSLPIPTQLKLISSGPDKCDYTLWLGSPQSINVYLCDIDGNKVQLLAEDLKQNEERFIGIPSKYQFDHRYNIVAIPVDKDSETVDDKEYVADVFPFPSLAISKLLDVSLSSPVAGVFSETDSPKLIINGLNHFMGRTMAVSVNDSPVIEDTVIVQGKDREVIDLSSSSDGRNELNVKVSFTYFDGSVTSTYYDYFTLYYLYASNGLAGIQVDKVYQAYVMESVSVGSEENPINLFAGEYRTLMFKETDDTSGQYYLLTAHVDDGMQYSMTIGAGDYEINKEDSTIHLECTKFTPSGPEPVEDGITATIDNKDGAEIIVIDKVEYTLLNNQVSIPNLQNKLEGAWELRTISPSADVLNSTLAKYMSAFELPPDMVAFNEGEGIALDVNVSIEDGKFSAAVSVDADMSALSKSVSLAEDFVPYAVLSGELVDGDIVSVAGFSTPVVLSTTADGSVLNVLYYFSSEYPVVISLQRAEAFDVPDVKSGRHFANDKIVSIDSVLNMAKELVGVSDMVGSMIESMNMPTVLFDSTGNKISLTGHWTTESTIDEFDDGYFSFLFGYSFYSNDVDALVGMSMMETDEYREGAEILFMTDMFGKKYGNSPYRTLSVNKICSVSEDEVVLDVTYKVDGTSIIRTGTVTLKKQCDGMIDTMEQFVKNNVPMFGLLTFTSKGEIRGKLQVADVADYDMVVGHYALEDGRIIIEVDTDSLTSAGLDLGDLKACAGMVLTYSDDEIMLFEKFDEKGEAISFGLKLTDAE